jgi:hypothetical protein
MEPRLMKERGPQAAATAEQPRAIAYQKLTKRRLRSLAFAVGDGLFLLLVGAATIAVMHLMHSLHWNLALTLICGMVVAMAVQVILAMSVAPILGSIESMIPSMVVAMISPMIVCALDLVGGHLTLQDSIALGGVVSAGVFLFVESYAFLCRRFYSRIFSGE